MAAFTWLGSPKIASVVLLFTAVWAIFAPWSQVDAFLLDQSLIARELRVFVREALGVEELQVRYKYPLL